MAGRHKSMGVFGQALLVGAVSGMLFLAALFLVTIPERRSSTPGPLRHADDAAMSPHEALQTETPEDTAAVGGLFDPESSAVPVLVYHYFRANTTPLQFVKILGALFLNLPLLGDMDVWTQTAASFENQLVYLKREGYESIGLDDLAEWQRGARRIPPKSVVITIDDADRSFLDHAYPLLERLGFEATLFVVTSRVGKQWDGVDCLTWEELRRISDAGVVSIESHSHDLHRKVSTPEGPQPVFVAASLGIGGPALGGSWAQFVLDDLRESRALIHAHTGKEARFLAWPYGFANGALDSLAVLAGFTSTCTMKMGMNRRFSADARANANAAPGAHAGASARADSNAGPTVGAVNETGRSVWTRYEIRRLTVTARTSMSGFRKLLAETDNVPPPRRRNPRG